VASVVLEDRVATGEAALALAGQVASAALAEEPVAEEEVRATGDCLTVADCWSSTAKRTRCLEKSGGRRLPFSS
jgi:Tfp pilus assembly protein PilX